MPVKNPLNRKLTQETATEIKGLIYRGYTQDELATLYGLAQATIHRVVHGLAWPESTWPDGSTGAIDPNNWGRKRAVVQLPEQTVQPTETAPTETAAKKRERREESRRLIEALGDKAADDAQVALAAALHSSDQPDVSEPPAVQPRLTEPSKPLLSWLEITQKQPRNPLVRMAQRDKAKREAIRIVFSSLPEDQWSAQIAIKLVKQVQSGLAQEEHTK